MFHSIKHFNEISTNIFEKAVTDFYQHPDDIASFVKRVQEEVLEVALILIQETLESMDQMLCRSVKRKKDWLVERHSKKQLITSIGTVFFQKTLFTNRHSGEMVYLLDRIMGMEKHERMTADAKARLLEETVQTSYRRGGESVSLLDQVSKQTVKQIVHGLRFPQGWKTQPHKKEVEYLYVEADEDHIALQFRERKGDLVRNSNGQKNNQAIAKLIYVHEGIVPERPGWKRYKLVNAHYFSRTAEGCSNEELWETVYRYLQETYDLDKVKRIYLSSDGGGWIKGGLQKLGHLIHVLDQHHLEKYLTRLTAHMEDSAEDARNELHRLIREGAKEEFRKCVECLKEYLPEGRNKESLDESMQYILSNWTAARYRLKKTEGIIGSSTEGHVYHILSSRMSTLPKGWSLRGADKMAQLRAYYKNGGSMLELVREQRKELPKAAGMEEMSLSLQEILRSEKNVHGETGKYYEACHKSITITAKKQAYFMSHIWGL